MRTKELLIPSNYDSGNRRPQPYSCWHIERGHIHGKPVHLFNNLCNLAYIHRFVMWNRTRFLWRVQCHLCCTNLPNPLFLSVPYPPYSYHREVIFLCRRGRGKSEDQRHLSHQYTLCPRNCSSFLHLHLPHPSTCCLIPSVTSPSTCCCLIPPPLLHLLPPLSSLPLTASFLFILHILPSPVTYTYTFYISFSLLLSHTGLC